MFGLFEEGVMVMSVQRSGSGRERRKRKINIRISLLLGPKSDGEPPGHERA
jgi:hypothetical protein